MTHVGHHLPYMTTVADVLRLIHQVNGNAVQISLGDPSGRALKLIDDKDARKVCKMRDKYGFYIVVHGKFLYNFCRSGASATWQKNLLCKELQEANKIGADVVIHQGKNLAELGLSKKEAHRTFAANITSILHDSRDKGCVNKLLLENSARQGTECGYALLDLAEIYHLIEDDVKDRIGFCIDTCHIFVAGELDMRKGNDVQDWFDRFDQFIGLDHLSLIHFNDSSAEFNSGNDSHGPVPLAHIGKESCDGFRVVCKLAMERNIPMVLETPIAFMSTEIALLKEWSESE